MILLDEPFTAVDAATTQALLAIIQRWRDEQRTVLCVLHDIEQIKTYFTDCLLMARECIAWGSPQEVFTPQTLSGMQFFREDAPRFDGARIQAARS